MIKCNFMKACLIFALAGMASGCTGYSATGGPGKTVAPSLQSSRVQGLELVRLNSMILMPVEFDPAARQNSIPGSSFDQELEAALRSELGIEIIAPADAFGAGRINKSKIVRPEITKQQALEAAGKRGSDAVLLLKVHEFREREGSKVGVENPAAVFFSAAIYRAADGAEIWQASYNYKDQALTDNILRFGREQGSVSWKSAGELLRSGLGAMSRELASKRMQQFTGSRAPARVGARRTGPYRNEE